jgi:hypothetical protein
VRLLYFILCGVDYGYIAINLFKKASNERELYYQLGWYESYFYLQSIEAATGEKQINRVQYYSAYTTLH